ncbi:MAG: ABC transporter ATP-binding protein/permease [Bacteroidales bacterium]|nr:ABC transporter ATP-binding protein/permease [Bacteroidales bacterium]
MKPIWRVFRYLRYYPKEIVLNVVFNMLAVVFNLFSFVMLVPVIELFFGMTEPPAAEPVLAFNQEAVMQWAMWHLYGYKDTVGLLVCLLAVAAGYLSCSLLYNLCRYLGLYFLSPIRNGVLRRLRDDIYHKITILPISFFSARRKGDLISRMSGDLADIEWSVVRTLQSLVKDPINIIVFAATLVFINWKLFLLFLFVLPPAVWLIGKIGKSLKRNSTKGQEKLGEMMSAYKETLDNMEVVKAYGREKWRQQTFEKVNADYSRRMMRVARRKEVSSPLSEVLGTIGLGFILVIGGYAVVKGQLPASVFILFVIIYARLIPPVQAMVKAYSSLQKGSASAARIFEIIDADEKITEVDNAVVMKGFADSIVFDNVSFAYGEEEKVPVLQHIALTIPKGLKVAVVGPSGAGKTTLVDLLPRFYDPSEGEIRIDGIPIKQMNINSLRSNIGVVSQNCILFNDTIANNITFGLQGISEEQIRAAARIANADDFIMQQPDGYNTLVGDKGSALSGGQRQRISIARAVLRNPPILILDEATSALDNASQQVVQQALDNMMQGRTSIVIAHRLSTIENADLIVVLDHGTIVEQGTHQQLMQQGGLYKGLVEMQSFK